MPPNILILTLIACIPFTLLVVGLWVWQRHLERTGQIAPAAAPTEVARRDVRYVVRAMHERRVRRAMATRSTRGTGDRGPGTGDRGPGTAETMPVTLDVTKQEQVIAVVIEWLDGRPPTGDRLKVLLSTRKDFALKVLADAKQRRAAREEEADLARQLAELERRRDEPTPAYEPPAVAA